jgi:hypothetical protein
MTINECIAKSVHTKRDAVSFNAAILKVSTFRFPACRLHLCRSEIACPNVATADAGLAELAGEHILERVNDCKDVCVAGTTRLCFCAAVDGPRRQMRDTRQEDLNSNQ